MKLVTTVLFLFALNPIQASTQIRDRLIVENDTQYAYGFDLFQYWSDPINFPKDSLFDTRLSSCGRGYIAILELKNDSLFLLNLLNPTDHSNYDFKVVFGPGKLKSPIFTEWFTGNLVVEFGEYLDKNSPNEVQLKEFETEYSFSDGQFFVKSEFTNHFHKSEYQSDRKKFEKFVWQNLDPELINRNIKDSLKVYIQISPSKKEIIGDVKVFRCQNEELKKEIIRVVKMLPDFSAYYRRGQLYPISYTIPFRLYKGDPE